MPKPTNRRAVVHLDETFSWEFAATSESIDQLYERRHEPGQDYVIYVNGVALLRHTTTRI